MTPIPEYAGDIFQAPQDSALLHACNCVGSWGSGIALAMKQRFPAAYKVYHEYCCVPNTAHHQRSLLGTVLMIPPQEEDIRSSGRYWIICLFTSVHYGTKKDKPQVILDSTRKALMDLKAKVSDLEKADSTHKISGGLFTVRLNALAFGVPWEDTRAALEQSGMDIAVINNLELMREPEKSNVMDSMSANGFDLEAPLPWEKTKDTA